MDDAIELLLAAAAVALGSILQGASGVGGGFIAVPLLVMIDPALLPGPLVFGSMSISTVMAWRERYFIDTQNVAAVLLATIPGAFFGAWLLAGIDPGRAGLAFGIIILGAVVLTASGVHLPLNRTTGAIAGATAGAMAAVSGMGAPAIAVLYQRETGPRVRATLGLIYTCASALILVSLAWFDRFGTHEAIEGLWLMPGFMAGYLLSRPLARVIDRGATRIVVLSVSALAALALIADSL